MNVLVVDAIFLAIMSCMVYYGLSNEGPRPENTFTGLCNYDTTVLCADCFTEPANCSTFTGLMFSELHEFDFFDQFKEHSVRIRSLNGTIESILNINNLNRDFAIEKLRDSVCEELNVTNDCVWRDTEEYIEVLRQRVLDDNRFEGAIFCPSWDETGLTRFVETFFQKHLLTLMYTATNTQSLMVQLLSQHNLPVPSFGLQAGFTFIEYYAGKPLSRFYESPFPLRLKIANATIDAFLRFNAGVNNFRFYLTYMDPEDIFVNVLPEEDVEVTFVELSRVVIIDETSEIPSDDCASKYGYIYLQTACQLLLENQFDEPSIPNTEEDSVYGPLRDMLHHCVYCKAPDCKDRQLMVEDIQHVIASILYNAD